MSGLQLEFGVTKVRVRPGRLSHVVFSFYSHWARRTADSG